MAKEMARLDRIAKGAEPEKPKQEPLPVNMSSSPPSFDV